VSDEAQSTTWPLPKFYFSVTGLFDGSTASFQEITGLELGTKTVEYRRGDSPQFAQIKMPA
jgi:hypothetical protein